MKRVSYTVVLLGVFLTFGCGHPPVISAAGQPENLQPAAIESLITVHELKTYDLETGKNVYQQVCMVCHAMGVAGAPRYGSSEDWKARSDKGMEDLIKNALQGYQGEKGLMPARGGKAELSDEEVAAAVAYMVSGSQ